MERDKLVARIESYAETVGEFREMGIKTYRQMRGDLREINAHCEINGFPFPEMKEHYVNNCRRYFSK
jgi:hypothetical protein